MLCCSVWCGFEMYDVADSKNFDKSVGYVFAEFTNRIG